MLFSLSMLTRDDISPSKNNYSLTVISSIVKNNESVVCFPNRTWEILQISEIVPCYCMFQSKFATEKRRVCLQHR